MGSAVSAPLAGRLVPRLGRWLLVGALVLFGAGGVGLLAVALTVPGSVADSRVWLYLTPPLLLAGLGGGSVITPNQALSLAEVDVRGGSTAGGMLQTAQRIGSAVGTAVLGAGFVTSAGRIGIERGPARSVDYGQAYATALAVSLVFTAAALAVAVVDARRGSQLVGGAR